MISNTNSVNEPKGEMSGWGAEMVAQAGAEAEATAGTNKDNNVAEGNRVVISGMSGLFPGADSVMELGNVLYNGVNPVTTENARWKYNHPEVSNYIGKVSGLDRFDAQFFKVYYQLGNNMDAMVRKLLEQSYQAIYDAGLSPEHLYGKKIGVYIGSSFSETEQTFFATKGVTGRSLASSSKTMFANRISYYLNAKGPSMSLDVVCSSSITALQLAARHILTGECEAAIVGGCYICLHPKCVVHFGRIMKLSKDGKTRSFDENADGCAKSEAINVVFLQKAKDALRIYAEILGANTEFTSLLVDDGVPRYGPYRDPSSTVKFLKEFYEKVNVSPNEVEYVEAYGTAEPEADKQELEAIDEVFGKNRKNPLLIGSVMSNLGYTEAASGITALTKVLLGYHKGSLASNLNCETPRRDVSGLRDGRLRVLTKNTAFRRGYAAINSVSVTGVNGHVLLRGCYKPKDLSRYKSSIPRLVLISGREESAVFKIFQHLKYLPVDPEQLALLNNIHLTQISGNLSRGYLILDTRCGNGNVKDLSMCEKVEYFDYVKRPLWFVYSGMGSQWAGMGAQLMQIPTFAAAIKKCHKVLQAKGIDLLHIVTTTDPKIFDNVLHSFVGISAIQIGLTDVLLELGLVPDNVIGHSLGEMGCAYADGCLSAEETILCAYARGLVSLETPLIRGSMAAVGIGYQEILPLCPPDIEVACHNGPNSCTISGPEDSMRKFVGQLTSKNIYAKEVPCSNIAYHSRYIAPAGPGLLKYLKEVIKSPKLRSERWLSTSVPKERWNEERARYNSAEYHTNNLLSSVLFEETSRLIPADAVVVEVAPHALLQAILKRSLPQSCKHVPLTRRHSNSVMYFLEAIGKLYIIGFSPKIQNLYPKIEFPVSTETPMLSHFVEWVHREKWGLPQYLSACKKRLAAANYVISIHDEEHAYLQGHVIRNTTVYPFAAVIVAVWDALCMSKEKPRRQSAVRLRDVKLYAQPTLHTRRQLRISIELHRGSGRFQVKDDLDSNVADGYVTEQHIDNIKTLQTIEDIGSNELEVTSTEIYHYFHSRDMNYENEFQSIQSTNIPVTQARIYCRGNWVTFIDALIQLNTLRHPHNSYSRPASIKDLFIDPEQFKNESILPAIVIEEKTIRCGGVIMYDLQFVDLPKPIDTSSMLKTLKFVPCIESAQKVENDLDEDLLQMNECNETEVPLESALVGQLEQLHWVQAAKPEGPGVAVKVHYAGLNILDLKKTIDVIPSDTSDPAVTTGYGMDFSGITESGQRVMGLVQGGAARSHISARPELVWPVPPHWSLQDAATVPLAYCLAYYCLLANALRFNLYPGMRVLIHGGAGALGQALISIALAHDCEVFTTVSDVRKKQFLLKLFPKLKEMNVYNSRDPTFADQVLVATKSEGVHLIICNLSTELKNASTRCLGLFGYNIDVTQIPNRDDHQFGMYNLEEDRSYCYVDINSIFKQENYNLVKQLQLAVAEGIARGCVRPLTRATYEPQHAGRALRLLAAGNQRGRVLIQMQAVAVLRRLACSSDRSHVVVSDHQGFGQQLADKLISRGVRHLHLYLPLSPKYYQLKLRYLRNAGIQVRYEALTDPRNIANILNDRHSFGDVEGVYVVSSNNRTASEWTSFIKDVDRVSKQHYSDAKYFAVINTGKITGEDTDILRVPGPLATTIITMVTSSEIKQKLPNSMMMAIEKALLSKTRGVLQAHCVHEPHPSLLQQLATLLEIEIPNDRKATFTLSDLGLPAAKLNRVYVFLRDTYNVALSIDAIRALTAERIQEIEEILTKTDFDDKKGLNKLFSNIDSDELNVTTDMVFLPTLANTLETWDDEWNSSEGYRCLVVVGGLEGQRARFRPLCARLKLPALLLQPAINRPHHSHRQLAHYYVQIMLKKANIRNNFYLLGYESGVLVALEMAAILEDNGYTGTVFCIGSPEEIKTEIWEVLRDFNSAETLQDGILMHMFRLITGKSDQELQAALAVLNSWEKKVATAVRRLTGLTPHSAQYARQLIEAAYGRTVQFLKAELKPRPLKSRIILLRPSSSRPMQSRWPQYEAVFPLAAPLADAAEDLRCANIINTHLDAEILRTFDKSNLCEFHVADDDTFEMYKL